MTIPIVKVETSIHVKQLKYYKSQRVTLLLQHVMYMMLHTTIVSIVHCMTNPIIAKGEFPF